MAMFGPDWRLAVAGWRYPAERLQGFWRAIGITVVLLLVNLVLQSALGILLVLTVLHGTLAGAMAHQGDDYAKVLQAGVLVIFPAGLVTLFLGSWLAKFGLPGRTGKLLLKWPKLGWLGWPLMVIGFAVIMFIVLNLIFYVSGVDPETYTTSSAGLSDAKSSAGLVEKTIAGMAAHEPWLFALAIPAIVFGAPLAEEITFRGPLFSALVKSPVGKVGAVLITAALWAGAHGVSAPPLFIGLLFAMGIGLGLLLLRFGSLWVTIACHSAWNLMTAFALLGAAMTR
jgi:membrane protease YdiL (CAAX protease family)